MIIIIRVLIGKDPRDSDTLNEVGIAPLIKH